ncbi:MAG: quinone-dependent dihydroorotate dehydrogenase [Nitrospirota bacterium]
MIKIRNTIIHILYITVLKPILFTFDPEKVHDFFIYIGRIIGSNPITRGLNALLFSYSNKKLEQKILGIKFKNPIGLAAGFDKDAKIIKSMKSTGFGYTEVGSITGEPCEGNPKPRLWRLKKSKGLIVYYGLKNEGCEKIAKKLKNKKFDIPVGISIAKTNCKATATTEAGIKDYAKAFKVLHDLGDYFTINISCPNAYGGFPFTDKEKLEKLLEELEKTPTEKPVFLKLAPDLSHKEIDEIIEVADNHKIAGFICTNLTKDRDNKDIKQHLKDADPVSHGGISGKPIRELSTKVIKNIYKKTKGKYVIIGCGGVFSAQDAYEKIKAGASLIQLITGMIFEGPQIISEINKGLVALLEKDGHKNISEAVGTEE